MDLEKYFNEAGIEVRHHSFYDRRDEEGLNDYNLRISKFKNGARDVAKFVGLVEDAHKNAANSTLHFGSLGGVA